MHPGRAAEESLTRSEDKAPAPQLYLKRGSSTEAPGFLQEVRRSVQECHHVMGASREPEVRRFGVARVSIGLGVPCASSVCGGLGHTHTGGVTHGPPFGESLSVGTSAIFQVLYSLLPLPPVTGAPRLPALFSKL